MGLPKARIPPKPHATFSLVRQVLTRVVREVAYAVSQIHAISFDKAAVRLLKQKRDFGFHGSGTDHRKIQLPRGAGSTFTACGRVQRNRLCSSRNLVRMSAVYLIDEPQTLTAVRRQSGRDPLSPQPSRAHPGERFPSHGRNPAWRFLTTGRSAQVSPASRRTDVPRFVSLTRRPSQ